MLDQRSGRMHPDYQFAIGRGFDILGELLDILGVEVGLGVGGWHLPDGFGGGRRSRKRNERRDC